MYERDTVTRSYASAGYYCARPEVLAAAAIDADEPEDYERIVTEFK